MGRFCRNCLKCSLCITVIGFFIVLGPLTYKKLDSTNYYMAPRGNLTVNDLKGKIIIVAGETANSRIRSIYNTLCEHGATVIVGLKSIHAKHAYDPNLQFIHLNFSNLQSINDFVARFKSNYSSVNTLIDYVETGSISKPMGKQFALDYLGHFYLTNKLTSLLYTAANQSSKQSRVIHVVPHLHNGLEYHASRVWSAMFCKEYMKRYGIYCVDLNNDSINRVLHATREYFMDCNMSVFNAPHNDKLGASLWNLSSTLIQQTEFAIDKTVNISTTHSTGNKTEN